MPTNEDCPVFAFKGTDVSVGEVLRAALFRNELQASVDAVAWMAACEERASEEELEADERDVEAMVERFRVDNDLISADETEAWLDKRGIDADDLQTHFARCLLRDAVGGKVAAVKVGYSSLNPELLRDVKIDLFISGAFSPLAIGLSRRLLAWAAAGAPPDAEGAGSERARFLERTGIGPGEVPQWLASLGRSQEWLDRMIAIESAYLTKCRAALTPERLSRALAGLRQPLTRLELETVEFDSIDAAREGRLCVRDDGMSLAEVARQSRFPYRRAGVWAFELPEDLRQKLLCAGLGEVQDPALSGGVFNLSCVIGKTEPTLDDPAVRGRVERGILDAYFSELGGGDISWFIS